MYLYRFGGGCLRLRVGMHHAGNNALMVKAKAVKGGSNAVNPVNVVVSPEDADRILLAATNKADLFRNGAIVFVR